jgi:DNA-binding transcriptional LysR family regulator
MGGEPAPRSPSAAGRRSTTATTKPEPARAGSDPGPAGRAASFDRPPYTLEQLRTFLAVASREHITQAARILRLSQSAVTQQVQLFERALGIQLLERVGRNIRLTNPGLEVAAACLLIMRALDNLENVVQSVRDLRRGAVRVGASQLAATYYLPPVIAQFTRAHPQINLGLIVAPSCDVCQQVAAGDLDCALVDGTPPPMPNLLQTWVATTEVVLVAHPSRAGWAPCEDLLPSCCQVAWVPRSTGGERAPAALSEGGDNLGPRLHLDFMEAARRLVRGSPDFVAAMPLIGVREDLASGTLARLNSPREPLPVFAVRRDGPDSPAREALWRLLSRPPAEVGSADEV